MSNNLTGSKIWNAPRMARYWFGISFLISAFMLCGAWFFEYVMHLHPCQMCYWQRHAHKAIIGVAVIALIVRLLLKSPKFDKIFLYLLIIAFAVSFGIAFWHMGVEYKWWEGPKSCLGGPVGEVNPEDILKAISGSGSIMSCGDVQWSLLGLSMAGYNAVISGLAAIASAVVAIKGKQS